MANYDETYALIAERIAAGATRDWLERCREAGVPAAAIRAYPEVVADEQFQHRGAFIDFPSPNDRDRQITLVRAGYQTGEDGPDTRLPPPRLGEHTDEILAEAGYSTADVSALREAGVV